MPDRKAPCLSDPERRLWATVRAPFRHLSLGEGISNYPVAEVSLHLMVASPSAVDSVVDCTYSRERVLLVVCESFTGY